MTLTWSLIDGHLRRIRLGWSGLSSAQMVRTQEVRALSKGDERLWDLVEDAMDGAGSGTDTQHHIRGTISEIKVNECMSLQLLWGGGRDSEKAAT